MVYLEVNADTIESHLSLNENWKTRGIYKLAEEKGEGGWRKLEQCHREERVESYRRVADIVIDADNKTPEEIVLASLDKIKERFGINIIEQIKDVNLHSKWTF